MSPVSYTGKDLLSGEAKRRPLIAKLNRKKPQESNGTTHFSDQTRRVGGFPLRNWLARKGIVVDAAITKKQDKELRTVFDLFDVDGSGEILPPNLFHTHMETTQCTAQALHPHQQTRVQSS